MDEAIGEIEETQERLNLNVLSMSDCRRAMRSGRRRRRKRWRS